MEIEKFAQLLEQEREADMSSAQSSAATGRRIELSETCECTLPPDAIQVVISCSATKPTADASKESVHRRIDYILQTLRVNHIKESQFSKTKVLALSGGEYTMNCEVVVQYPSLKSYETVTNILVEKLEGSISISPPIFKHSPGKIDTLRHDTCMEAVKKSKSRAAAIAQYMKLNLGALVVLSEEENELHRDDSTTDPISLQDKIQAATVKSVVRVRAIFETSQKISKTKI